MVIAFIGAVSCFYCFLISTRAIADQLEGSPAKHGTYRKKICDFISQNREDYEPFIEDDETFDGVCHRSVN